MRQTVYKCDQCKVEIGDKKHISLQFSNYSGISIPPHRAVDNQLKGYNPNWHIVQNLQGKFVHFCNSVCIGRFFSELYKKAK